MRRAALGVATVLLLAACNPFAAPTDDVEVEPDAQRTLSPSSPARADVTAERAGFSILGDKLTVALTVRNNEPNPVAGITARVTLVDDDDRDIASFEETIPFCAAHSSCWWGSMFAGDEFGDRWRETGTVRVRVVGTRGSYDGAARPLRFDVGRNDRGLVTGRAPADEGMAVVIAVVDGAPRSGIAVNVKKGRGFSLNVRIPPRILPRAGPDEKLRGFMYPVTVPEG